MKFQPKKITFHDTWRGHQAGSTYVVTTQREWDGFLAHPDAWNEANALGASGGTPPKAAADAGEPQTKPRGARRKKASK